MTRTDTNNTINNVRSTTTEYIFVLRKIRNIRHLRRWIQRTIAIYHCRTHSSTIIIIIIHHIQSITVIGQKRPIVSVFLAIRRVRSELHDPKRVGAFFILCGPTVKQECRPVMMQSRVTILLFRLVVVTKQQPQWANTLIQ